MAKDLTKPDPSVVLDLLQAFRWSKTMFAAVSLGVFDALSEGSLSLEVLARRLEANPDALERLLDGCVGLQLLDRDNRGYRNTPASAAYLCRKSPVNVASYIHYSNTFYWKLWANLEDAVREGANRWKQAFGWEDNIFANVFRTEEAKREFTLAMHGYGLISSPVVVACFDLSRFRRFVDVGGATGHWAAPRLAIGSKSSPATFLPIRFLPATFTDWDGSCTTGPRRKSTNCSRGFMSACRPAGPFSSWRS
jgi:acetylserotonin N-methyltransferase